MKLWPSIGLILLGGAIGFVVTMLFGFGQTVSLFVGVLLVIAGAIIGFVIEWIIDEAHRQNRDQIAINVQASLPEHVVQSEASVLAGFLTKREDELQQVRGQLSTAEKALVECRAKREAQVKELEALPQIRQQLSATEAELAQWKVKPQELQTKLETAQAALADYRRKQTEQVTELEELRTFKSAIEAQPDDLTVIKGIGRVYQQKLRNIGITKLKQLADADPERLKRMLEVRSWQGTDVASWVMQAADWVQRLT